MVALTDAHKEEAVRRIEKEFARRNFISPDGEQPDFLDHVKILERSQLHSGKAGGAAPFQKWDYIKELATAISENRLVTVLKARQLGFSWTSAAYAAWLVTFIPAQMCL